MKKYTFLELIQATLQVAKRLNLPTPEKMSPEEFYSALWHSYLALHEADERGTVFNSKALETMDVLSNISFLEIKQQLESKPHEPK